MSSSDDTMTSVAPEPAAETERASSFHGLHHMKTVAFNALSIQRKKSKKGQAGVKRSDIQERLHTAKYGHDEDTNSPFMEWRQRMSVLLNEPNSSREAAMLSVFLVVVIIASVIVITLATVEDLEGLKVFDYLEVTFACLFAVELLVRCFVQYSFRSRKDYFKEMFSDVYFYVDFIAVLPSFIDLLTDSNSDGLQLLKALRVFRLFKLFRQFQGSITLAVAIEESIDALTVPFFFLIVSAVTFGVFIFYIETIGVKLQSGSEADPTFHSIPHAIWFIFVTMTTVGYGDVSTVSALGRSLNIIAMVFGVLFLSMPIAILGNNFVMVWGERHRIMVITRIKEAMMRGGVNRRSVQEAFEAIDTDQSGSVNLSEFIAVISALKIDMATRAIKKLWHTIDVDGSGEIRVEEFAELLFPEVGDLDDFAGKETVDSEVVSTDPVLTKLLQQEKLIGEMSERMAAMAAALERLEKKLA